MLDKIALTLLIIGGLNWGSVGIFQFDLVAWICGGQTGIISRIVLSLSDFPQSGALHFYSGTQATP